MPVDRIIYKTPFHKGKQPQWLCPTCEKGILQGNKGSFFYKESRRSEAVRQEHSEEWEPEWMEYTYSCSLSCTNPQCKETIASVGTGSVDFEVEFDETSGEPMGQEFYDYFQPKFFWPPLNIFSIPKDTPEPIREEIKKSFELFFSTPASSSNHIRIALEKILDWLKVRRYEIKSKRRIFISLHKRIILLPNTYNELRELLFAIKWLGNTGSHSLDITVDDVMDAYDILEVVLNELFEKRATKIKKLAKSINKKKGPQGKIKVYPFK